MSVEVKTIPYNWTIVNLVSVCKLINGYAFKSTNYIKNNGVPVVRISDIGDGKVDLMHCVHVLPRDDYKPFEIYKDDILVAMSGATTGKFGIYKSEKLAYQNQRVGKFKIIDYKILDNKFLLFLLYSLKRKILEDAYGGAQPNISSGKIELMEIPLPPLREQHRIVDKIEELFSDLDKGIESLKTAQQQLKVYRQAVLKSAFMGDFTKDKRAGGKYPKVLSLLMELDTYRVNLKVHLKYPPIQNDNDLPQIPNEWKWVRNEALLKYVTSGSRDWKKYYNDKGSVFIRTQDIKTNVLDLNDAAFVLLPKKVEGKRSLVEPNDLLMTITGANVGRVAIIPKDIPESYVSQSVALMKLLDNRISRYLWYYFQSRTFGEGLVGGLVYGVGRPVLSLENMREVPVALCSVEEQEDIVQEIESRLSVCDKIEENIEQSLLQAEVLRQSILKKAFEGKLVPQDPDDEPASVLLERIKQAREQQSSSTKLKVKKAVTRKTKAVKAK